MRIKAITKKRMDCVVHNIGVVDDESYVVEGVKVKNCRGIWVEILKDEAELPKVTGVPDSLLKRYKGGVNDLDQLDKPIVQKGSLADDYWKGELSKENKGI